MKATFVRVAIAKASDPIDLAALQNVEAAARALEHAEASFEDRINANKALRGESPTMLSRGRQTQLDGFTADQIESDRELTEQLSRLESSYAVIEALHFGLTQDIPRARSMLKHYHPADYLLGEELVNLKEKLVVAMSSYLTQRPVEG